MKKDVLNTYFPGKKWLACDWFYLGVIALSGSLVLLTGLSVRSLWGSEGRWAEIAREMLASKNYFLPTINGLIYFDKPLLSYWAIIPFAFNGVVTEASARMPGALAGIGTLIITFAMGRRLFDNRTGLISSFLLMTSAMFVLWSRTASAEILNVLAIWLSLIFFIRGAHKGSLPYMILMYGTCAISSFFKGPVAPAVVFFSITFYSIFETISEAKHNNYRFSALKESFLLRFRWIISWQGMVGVIIGLVIFTTLLLLPVIVTGSWSSVELMWRENVQRFFRPFDHIEPFYAYFKHLPVFFLPWTIFMIASCFFIRQWAKNPPDRFILLITFAIFLFFTISGSRRSYYILPVLPGVAIISGKLISDLIKSTVQPFGKILKMSMISTCTIIMIAGIGIIVSYFDKRIPSHPSQIAIGILTILACITCLKYFRSKAASKGIAILIAVVFVIELWVFNVGMAAAEKNRTLRPFAIKAADYLKDVGDERILLYQGYDSILIFYLKRKPLKVLNTAEEIRSFQKAHGNGFLIGQLSLINRFRESGEIDGISLICAEKPVTKDSSDNLALFSLNR